MKRPQLGILRRLRAIVRGCLQVEHVCTNVRAVPPALPTPSDLEFDAVLGPHLLVSRAVGPVSIFLSPPVPSLDGQVRPRLRGVLARGAWVKFPSSPRPDADTWSSVLDADAIARAAAEAHQRVARLLASLARDVAATLQPHVARWEGEMMSAMYMLRALREGEARYVIVREGFHDARAYEALAANVYAFGARADWRSAELAMQLESVSLALAGREDDFERFERAARSEMEADRQRRIWRASPPMGDQDAEQVVALARHASADELRTHAARKSLFVSWDAAVVDDLRAQGFAACRPPLAPDGRTRIDALERQREALIALERCTRDLDPTSAEWVTVHRLIPRLKDQARAQAILHAFVEGILRARSIRSFVALDESPLSVGLGHAFRARGVAS